MKSKADSWGTTAVGSVNVNAHSARSGNVAFGRIRHNGERCGYIGPLILLKGLIRGVQCIPCGIGRASRGIGSLLIYEVGFKHRIQLIRVNPSNTNGNDENQYLEEELPHTKPSPPWWRWFWTVIGVAMFGWGRWTLGEIAVVATVGGVILALWSA
jgi:hypothetical protein